MDFKELSTLMRESGIVGCGGAGFPSYAKLDSSVDTLIVNCAECEPLLRLHRQLMEKKTYEVLYAVDLIAKTIGVKNVIIALKNAYKKAIASLEANLPSFKNIRICQLKEVYPAGDEVVLIYEATGRIVGPGKLPKSVGCIVYNVETVFNVYRALNGRMTTHKYVTVAGEVRNPSTFYCPIGTPFKDLIDLAGGETIEDPEYLLGGPMMGRLGSINETVTKTTNAIILLPRDHYVVERKRSDVKIDIKRAMAACCQCRYCTDMCPRHLLGHPIEPSELMRVISNQDSHNIEPYLNTMFCSGCGICEMYSCFQGLSPRTLIGKVKTDLRKAGITPPVIEEAPIAVANRELRRVPLKRLRARLDVEKYNKSANISELMVKPDKVRIMLSQHVGAPSIAIVNVGDKVSEGTVIAKAKENALSVNTHSSIDGMVTLVTDKFIEITR